MDKPYRHAKRGSANIDEHDSARSSRGLQEDSRRKGARGRRVVFAVAAQELADDGTGQVRAARTARFPAVRGALRQRLMISGYFQQTSTPPGVNRVLRVGATLSIGGTSSSYRPTIAPTAIASCTGPMRVPGHTRVPAPNGRYALPV